MTRATERGGRGDQEAAGLGQDLDVAGEQAVDLGVESCGPGR